MINLEQLGRNLSRPPPASARAPAPKSLTGEIVLLSGGNPQIAKGYGDGPVQASTRRT